jgi:iron complex transport system ATP-binding protein
MIPTGTPLLEATGLDCAIGGRVVCRGLDLNLRRGERLAILGRNGAGKSTLLSTLAGLHPPAAGRVLLGGAAYGALHEKEAACRRGFLPQVQHDAFASSVLETALIGRHPHLSRFAWESADDESFARTALEFVGLKGMEQRSVHSLSGGERQRLGVATLLTQEPDLYLLDEPLTHLDLCHAIAVLEVFTRCAEKGAGVVMVLHEPGLAARYSDRVLLLHGDAAGGRCELGPTAEMLTAERLSALYGHPLRALDDAGRAWFVPA